MDKDFTAKVRRKRNQKIAGILILIALCVIIALSVLKPWRAKDAASGTATIEIRCDQLSQHPEALNDPGLADYIPADGTILAKTEVAIEAGKTSVFDILNQACREKNVQMESSYSPGYDSHYVEGIGYLYEFSAGRYSGWIFTVNGEEASYGADKILLNDGDAVLWDYMVDYRDDD